ncbi:MAG: amidohydrolase family protein, partial [Coriobacteriales bacterium]|nr:amidohydrolase family protein [Coriobacteriales bacterium]
MAEYADRVFKNAKIWSIEMDDTETHAQALAIKDGKFVYVGDEAGVEEFVGPDTQITDCGGNTILPGFGDAHMHIALANRKFGVCDVNGALKDPSKQTCDDLIKEIQAIMKKWADEHPNDKVLHGCGWEHAWFNGLCNGEVRKFTRHDLDAAVSDRPFVMDSADGHQCVINTAAIKAAGLSADTPEPEGGLIRREEDGYPDGYLQEPVVIGPVCHSIPNFEFSDEEVTKCFDDAQKFFASRGFTLLCDCMRDEKGYEIIKKVAEDGGLVVRIDGVYNCNDATREDDFKRACELKGTEDFEDLLKIDTVKYFAEGDFAMLEPWEEEFAKANGKREGFGTTDGLLWDIDHLKESMEKFQKEGFNIHVHSFGDLCTRLTLDCMEHAQNAANNPNMRNIIAHCSWISDEDRDRFAKLGVIASIQPQWQNESWESNPAFTSMIGRERHAKIYPNGDLINRGVVCAYGSDFPVTVTDAMDAITISMTRKFSKKSPFYELLKDYGPMVTNEFPTLKQAIKGW